MKKRKDVAKTFLRMVASGKVRAAYERFVGPGFRHHNAYYPGDAASLQAGMEDAAKKSPKTTIEIQRALQEGALVAVHSRVKHKPSDIGMEVPAQSPNEHGVF